MNFGANLLTNYNEELTEKFYRLFPSIPLMLATLAALVISIFFLTYFFYKPIRKNIKKRKQYIQDNIDAANKLKQQSLENLEESNKKLNEAREQASEIINSSKRDAELIVINYKMSAQKKSEEILKKAQLEIKRKEEEFLRTSREEIIDAATIIAKKILIKEIDSNYEKKIIDDISFDSEK
ncbi:ATP SYNTHASE B CHAIN [Mycoplasmopsis pulmonis]|uniref:ATP synthase subunit b n=1 Tax=Mycoplasmopsis pulmonis (strain UAB CTIP) TaxID=272635 RepID=ATPF_MYCPU|nr:F0F1 ATP synthase subunit B [Mycoplasmopsis pulmonis]Q98QU1.1 RecName: Full=ATP synthase subunit b; AltName: Full=ATP synthase F(0) sector subunit b; AltName: Full=ATPase subunit I; AltName: Full=F-type ATPase subunit b; Short=F-ATPase subunit b [Mycoplasmopsis pulmonis UAB CTIP]MDZ7293229.1 F0F1 ATP synthase subunit B [Mycoplasmopsis pulmonis]CAC13443.1 ATP SYNTHASE B CHAIN [Mycoplasmopsis pulmonis]VEU68031.1 ATP synthase subunit B [Mycoplasmopsis pulmonis]